LSPTSRGALGKTIAASFVLWLTWGGLVSLASLGKEVASAPRVWPAALTRSPDERWEATLERQDKKEGRAPGYLTALLRAIAEHVPEHETIFVIGLRERRAMRFLLPVQPLAFPRQLSGKLVPLPANWQPAGECYLCLDPALRPRLEGRARLLASGSDWTLWR
jgi:hypothetical protein